MGSAGLRGVQAGSVNRSVITDTELVFVSLAVGGDHTCGLADGSVYCWGANDRGQLGGSSAGGATPVPIEVGAS